MISETCVICGWTIRYEMGTGDEYIDIDGDIVGWPIPDDDMNAQPHCWTCGREASDEIREANPDPDDAIADDDIDAE